MLFMTVPTAGNREELLNALIRDSGLSSDRIVVVATRSEVVAPSGVIVVEDLGAPNIQRWWNLGIEAAVRHGARTVAVVNDDVRLAPTTLPKLESALWETRAAIASPAREPYRLGLHRGSLVPYAPRLWGSLWVLRVDSGLRPDPRYVWWYGDNDLDIRARRDHGGVALVDVPFEHLHPSEGLAKNPVLAAQTDRDAVTFETQYARLLRQSRRITRMRSLLGLGGADDAR
jgi:hypothetical protein